MLKLLVAALLLALTVIVHVVGMRAVFRRMSRSLSLLKSRFWAQTWLVARSVWWLINCNLDTLLRNGDACVYLADIATAGEPV